MSPMNQADRQRHARQLRTFIQVYCRHHCSMDNAGGLCPQCQDLLDHALSRLEKCPFDPKPKCKDCQAHCYGKTYRDQIRKVMRFSGMHFVKRGRLDWLVRYFFSR